jgi:dienelactone hydrolase
MSESGTTSAGNASAGRAVGASRARLLAVGAALAAVLGTSAAPAAAEARLEGDLPRAAALGFSARERGGALIVAGLDGTSAAARAGLRAGDRLEAVQGRALAPLHVGLDLLRRLDGDAPVELAVRRGDERLVVRFTPPPLPLEDLAGVEEVYGVLEAPDGSRLRTLLTRPTGARGALPAVFVTQWVSCDSIEVHSGDGAAVLLRALAERSGMATIRVERASGGDSEGPGCHELDYDTEVAHYRHALARLARHPWIDPHRVVVLGLSLGGTTAPLVAQGYPVAGVVVTGAGAATYYERMLAFDRLAFERLGDPREVHRRLLAHARFHQAYLLDAEDPHRIAERHPELREVWPAMRGTGEGVHYGRPYAWHRQAARRDLLAAWAALGAPVLVLYAEYDQFEPAAGHRLIVETRNRLQPGSAEYVEIPRMGHDFAVYPSPEDAMRWERGVPAPELVVHPILGWLRARGLAASNARPAP